MECHPPEDIVRHRVLRKGQFILETRELEMIVDLQICHKIEKGAGFRRPLLVRMLSALGHYWRRSFAFADLGTPGNAHKRKNRSGCNH